MDTKKNYLVRISNSQIDAFDRYAFENKIPFLYSSHDMGPNEVTFVYSLNTTPEEALKMKLSVPTVSFISRDNYEIHV